MTRQRLLVLAPLVVVLLFVAGFYLLDGPTPDPAEERLRAVSVQPEPDTYVVDDLVDASQLLGCFFPVVDIQVRVDRNADIAALRLDGNSTDQVILIDGRSYVRSDLLVGWDVPAEWLTVDAETSPAIRTALGDALPAAVARYVLRLGLPDGPVATARALAETADDLRVEPAAAGGARIVGTVDPGVLGDDAEQATGAEPTDKEFMEVVLSIDADDMITEIAARITSSGTQDRFGVRLRFRDQGRPVEIHVPAPSMTVDGGQLDPRRYPPLPLVTDCEIG